jgi:hypothetical protein
MPTLVPRWMPKDLDKKSYNEVAAHYAPKPKV